MGIYFLTIEGRILVTISGYSSLILGLLCLYYSCSVMAVIQVAVEVYHPFVSAGVCPRERVVHLVLMLVGYLVHRL